jgi:hypothetical protein
MLPSDRYLAELLGLTEEQYAYWRDELQRRAERAPQPAVVAGIDPISIAITIVIAVGLQLIGNLLSPTPSQARPAQLQARNQTGASQNSLQNFAPRVGFDAVQDVASLGAPIPVVYANREVLDGITYGGVRINASLLWSQIWSLGGSQMLRAVFMLAEGKIASIDPEGFAIGDNSIGVYDLGSSTANELGSRITIYYRSDGGRFVNTNRIYGRAANADRGNAVNASAADVFQVQSIADAWRPDFCAATKPSTSTSFGVYSPIGNNLGFKANPSVRPGVTARLKPKGDNGDARVVCDLDNTVQAQRAKFAAYFSTRSGITSGSFAAVNDLVTYELLRSSDFNTNFTGAGASAGTWTAGKELRSWEGVYQEPVYRAASIPGLSSLVSPTSLVNALAVGSPTVDVGTRTVTIQATLNVDTIRTIYANAAVGKYNVRYWVVAANATRDLELRLQFDALVTVRNSRVFIRNSLADAINFSNQSATFGTDVDQDSIDSRIDVDVTVADDSGPVTALTTPDRLRADMIFTYTDAGLPPESADDVSSSIAARQKTWDDAIVVGELYKIGSALAVCVSRSPSDEVFRSDADLATAGSGQTIEAQFRIVRPGVAAVPGFSTINQDGLTSNPTRQTATSGPHIMRVAIAHGATTRECRVVEIGIRSAMGIRFNGLMRFRSTLTFAETDNRACLSKSGEVIKRGNTVNVDQYQSGQMATSEERYSFFRVSYKKQREASFVQLSQVFGIAGAEQQSMFNYLRLEFPSTDSWEWDIEPLSGWEIRNVVSASTLYVVDSRMSSAIRVTTTSGGRTVAVTFNGRSVSRAQATFALPQATRSSIGLPFVDSNNSYVDAWGKLSEMFVYDEVQSSVSSGPEHEIVYVNEIVPNDTAPLYDGIGLVGVNIASAFEWRQFSQLSAYVIGGTEVRRLLNSLSDGPSHLLPDLALDRLTNTKYGPGRITDEQVNLTSFQAAAQWCLNRRYFFDGGVIISAESPRQWIADTAGAMLLDFREVGGRYELVPFIPDPAGDGSTFGLVSHKALFTAGGNIAEGTFTYESIAPEDRQPVQISVKWRQERSSSNPSNPGLFPTEREVLVREAAPNGADTLPIEAIDVSDFCTNENHAIDVAKFTIRMRRLRDHTIKFQTTYDGLEGISSGVGPGDFIRVAMDTTVYDQFNSGVVLTDGTLISTQPLADGSYNAITWNGTTTAPNDSGTLVVTGGKASPVGVIFTIKQVGVEVRTYQISRITPADDGNYDIEAVHMPTGSNGRLLVAADWDEATAWVIRR